MLHFGEVKTQDHKLKRIYFSSFMHNIFFLFWLKVNLFSPWLSLQWILTDKILSSSWNRLNSVTDHSVLVVTGQLLTEAFLIS